MTLGILGFVLIYLSTAQICCVSAGGSYCAKSRARAAALGLNVPGFHRPADLSRLPPFAFHPRGPSRFQNNPQPPASAYSTLFNPPKEFPHPAGYGAAVQANSLSGLSGGDPLNDRQSNFEQVKRVVGPLSHSQPPGWVNFEDGVSQSHRSGLPFAYNGRKVGGVDPIRHGVSGMAGRFQPHSPGYGLFYRTSPVGAGSEPGVVYPVRQRKLPGHSAWPMYARANYKRRYPFYQLEE